MMGNTIIEMEYGSERYSIIEKYKHFCTNDQILHKYKNEVGCRDDTVPKTVDSYKKTLRGGVRVCNNLPQPKNKDVGIRVRKILHALTTLFVPTVFGTVSSLHPTSFIMIIILVSLIFYPGLALTV